MARVLIYAMNYAPEIAGVGRCTGEIGEFLVASGHSVAVVTTPPHYPAWSVAPPYHAWRYSRERRGGMLIERCPLLLRRRMGGLWRLIAPLTFALSSAPVALWRALRFRPDVVLCVEPTLLAAPAALVAARLVGARAVLHVQDLEVDAAFAVGHLAPRAGLRRLALRFEHAALARFDGVLTVSDRMAERLVAKRVSRDRLVVVRNWVDLEAFRPPPFVGASAYRRELGIPGDAFVALYSGSIGAKQGFDELIEAARRLARRADIFFVIAGDGPAKLALAAQVADLPNVRLLPFQPAARLAEFLGLADLHLLPQAKEAADLVLPSKLAGMLASGRRILVAAAAGTELADFLGEAAILTPPGEPAALARAIERAADARDDEPTNVAARLALAAQLSRADRLPALAAALFAAPAPSLKRDVAPAAPEEIAA
jgi:colanic acid biosynthesis glycosyl transferase WcaI